MKIVRYLSLSCMLVAVSFLHLLAEEPHPEKQKYTQRCVVKATSRLRWRLNGILEQIDDTTYLLREKGLGNYGEFQNIKWEIESRLQLKDNLLCPIYSITDVKDRTGNNNFSLRKDYDYQNQKIAILKTDAQQNIIDSAEFPLKNKTVDYVTLMFSLKPFVQKLNQKETVKFNLLSIEPQIYKIIARFEKEEEIQIDGRQIQAIKIRLTVDKGMLNLVLPNAIRTAFIWYEKTPPYACLRYEGLESGKNSPYVIIESNPYAYHQNQPNKRTKK